MDELLSIFEDKGVFAKEYHYLLRDHLFNMSDFNIQNTIRHIEMLKEKFGESLMANAMVMLRDVQDSRRICSHYESKNIDQVIKFLP